jgi:hypothetical protein
MLPVLALLLCSAACDATHDDASVVARDAAAEASTRVEDAGTYEFPCLAPNLESGAPTYSAVFREVFCAAGCANIYCHGSRGASGGLSFETMDLAYERLVGAGAGRIPSSDGSPTCSMTPLLRVEPGHPERSLLYLKIAESTAPCGLPMPPPNQGFTSLTVAQQEQLRAWIAMGASDDRATR